MNQFPFVFFICFFIHFLYVLLSQLCIDLRARVKCLYVWKVRVMCVCVWCVQVRRACEGRVSVWCVHNHTQTHVYWGYGSNPRRNMFFCRDQLTLPGYPTLLGSAVPPAQYWNVCAALPKGRQFCVRAYCCQLSLKRLLGGEPLYLSYRGEPPRSHNKGSEDSSGPGGFLSHPFSSHHNFFKTHAHTTHKHCTHDTLLHLHKTYEHITHVHNSTHTIQKHITHTHTRITHHTYTHAHTYTLHITHIRITHEHNTHKHNTHKHNIHKHTYTKHICGRHTPPISLPLKTAPRARRRSQGADGPEGA